MGMFAILIAMFPRDLPRPRNTLKNVRENENTLNSLISFSYQSITPLIFSHPLEIFQNVELPLKLELALQEKSTRSSLSIRSTNSLKQEHVPTMREFPAAMKRLLTNWLLTCNNLSGVFYVLGASAYITFLAKYLEVQYSTSAAGGTVIAGK